MMTMMDRHAVFPSGSICCIVSLLLMGLTHIKNVDALQQHFVECNRRAFLATTGPLLLPSVVNAVDIGDDEQSSSSIPLSTTAAAATAVSQQNQDVKQVLLEGTAVIADGVNVLDGPNAALYVTCRPDRPDNVPTAILSGTRGKPPPILTARFQPVSAFPFRFQLTRNDLTPEAEGDWWKADTAWVVSARYDTDGVASTRGPDDLVGRTVLSLVGDGNRDCGKLVLTGRGAFGKFATGQSK